MYTGGGGDDGGDSDDEDEDEDEMAVVDDEEEEEEDSEGETEMVVLDPDHVGVYLILSTLLLKFDYLIFYSQKFTLHFYVTHSHHVLLLPAFNEKIPEGPQRPS